MTLNGSTRSCVGRLNTASINASKQIFSRRNGKCCWRNGCARDLFFSRHELRQFPCPPPVLREKCNANHLFCSDFWNERFESSDVSRVEREQEVSHDFEFGAGQRIENGMHELFGRKESMKGREPKVSSGCVRAQRFDDRHEATSERTKKKTTD